MNCCSSHVFLRGNELEVRERTVRVIAVFPPEARVTPIREWTIRLFPDEFVYELPTVEWLRPGVAGLQNEIAWRRV